MTLTAAQANAQITSGMTVAQIRAIINQVDANPNASTVLLYGGGVGNIVVTCPP